MIYPSIKISIYKKTLTVLFIGLFLLVLASCDDKVKEIPYGNLSDNTYVEAGEYKVTEKELYDYMKLYSNNSNFESLTILKEKIDKFILQDELDKIDLTSDDYKDDYQEYLLKQIYSRTTLNDVQELEDDDIKSYEEDFESSLLSEGIIFNFDDNFNIKDENAIDSLLNNETLKNLLGEEFKFDKAKENIAMEELKNITDEDDENYISDEDVIDYYNGTYRKDNEVGYISVKYNNLNEAKDHVLDLDNDFDNLKKIIEYYNQLKYLDEDKIDIDFEENNTVEKIIEALKNNEEYNELFFFEKSLVNSTISTQVNKLKTSLPKDEETYQRYFTEPMKIGKNYYLIYKLQDEVTDLAYDKLSETEQEEKFDLAKEELLKDKLTSTYINTVLSDRFKDVELTVYDPVIEQMFINSYSITSSKETSNNKILTAKYNDKTLDVTVDELFTELEEKVGYIVGYQILANKYLLKNYKDKISSLNEDLIDEKTSEYENVIESFKNDEYSKDGYSKDIDQSIFEQLYFGIPGGEENIINYYYLQDTLYDLFLSDYKDTDYEKFKTYSDLLYNRDYSLDVSHILIYVDLNEDGTPDDPTLLDETVQQNIEVLVKELFKEIYDFISNEELLSSYEETFEHFKEEYDKSDRFNGEYQKYHESYLNLKYEDLSDVSIDDLKNYDEKFAIKVNEFIQNQLNDETKIDFDETYKDKPYLDIIGEDENKTLNFIKSSFGYHSIILNGEDTDHDSLTAKYEESSDYDDLYNDITINDDIKNINAYNEEETISINQIKIYANQVYTTYGVTSLPSSVKSYAKTYLDPVLEQYRSTENKTLMLIINLGTIDFKINKEHNENIFNKYQESLKDTLTEKDSYERFTTEDDIKSPYENWIIDFLGGAN